MNLWLLIVPAVAALQSFAVRYGFHGETREEASRSAWRTFVVVSVGCALLHLWMVFHG